MLLSGPAAKRFLQWHRKPGPEMLYSDGESTILEVGTAVPGDTPEMRQASEYNRRGLQLWAEGDQDGALAQFTQAIEACPKSYFYCDRARLNEQLGRIDDAGADWDAAFRCDGVDSDSYLEGAEFHARLGRLDRAMALCNAALAENLTPDGYTLRSALHQAFGNTQAAVEDGYTAYRIALESGWDDEKHRIALKKLLGKEPKRPFPLKERMHQVLDVLEELVESEKPFSPDLVTRLTGVRMREIPYAKRPHKHSNWFESIRQKPGEVRLWTHIQIHRPGAYNATRNFMNLHLNEHLCCVSVADVRARFGPCELAPNRDGGSCIIDPAHLEYNFDWGTMTLSFRDRGFEALFSVSMWVGEGR